MIYCFYNKEGFVDDYVTYFLESFRPYCKDICTVANGLLTKESEAKLKEYTEKFCLLLCLLDYFVLAV